MRTSYKFLRWLWPFVGPVVGIISLAALLDVTIGDVFSLYNWVVPRLLTFNVVLILLIVLFSFFTYIEFRHRNTPLTVISNEVSLTLTSASGDEAQLVRTQKIRANRDGVTGYHRVIKTSGRIPKDKISCYINHCPKKQQTCHFDGDEKGWDFVHRFPEIPRKLYMLGLNTVTRTEELVILDSFTNDQEFYDMEIPNKYPHRNMRIRIYFHPDRPVGLDKCEAIRITQNGIIDVNLAPVPSVGGSAAGVELNVRGNPGDRFRITWKYPPILQQQDASPLTGPSPASRASAT